MKLYNQQVLSDLFDSIKQRSLWIALGWNDVRARYRRSTLGPWWLTISIGITILGIGPLYGAMFKHSMADFIPHLALGFIFWGFILSSITESCDAFTGAAHYLKQTKLPFSIFISRVCYKHVIILGHNILIYPIILIILQKMLPATAIYSIAGFLLVLTNVYFWGFTLAIFCTRYRDMQPVVASLMGLLFFITPIIWKIDQLPESRRYMATLNPITSWLEIMRAPILGNIPDAKYWIITMCTALIGAVLALIFFTKTRHRITYWL
jgi:ABC-type polysaccharide/polyol phosphate export permease